MKKNVILAIILCLSLILFSGCGSSKKSYSELEAEVKKELEAELRAEQEGKTTEKTTGNTTGNTTDKDTEKTTGKTTDKTTNESADIKEKVQVSTSGDLILFNDDGSSKTLVKGSRGYRNMQSVTFLENKKVIVIMASYKSSPLGVYTYKLNDDSFTIVTEPVKEYSIVDNTIKVIIPDGSINYYDLNGYQVDKPGMSAPTTPNSEYERNKQYKFDFEGKGSLDTFSVSTDGMNYFDVIVNGQKYSITDETFLPELVNYKYKLTEIADTGRYALTFFHAAPPNGSEIIFYQYTVGSGVEKMGLVYVEFPDNDLFYADIKDLTYGSVSLNSQIHKFSRSVKLSSFTDEYMRGVQLAYNNYSAVVIPFYDGKNNSKLKQVVKKIGSSTQYNLTLKLNFAIFGTLTEVKVIYYERMGAAGIPTDLGTINNSQVFLDMWVPNNDMTYVKVTGKADKGNEYFEDVEFTLDDMRDSSNFDIVLIK